MNDRVRDMSEVFLHYGQTVLHPVALTFMIVMFIVLLGRSRSRSVFALMGVCVFMPLMQRVVIGGLDFSMLRIMVVAVWCRMAIRGDWRGFRLGKMDYAFLLWAVSLAVFHVLRVGPKGIVYRLGTSLDALGVFFAMRLLVRDLDDVRTVLRQFAWMMVVLGGFMTYEWVTQHNPFGVFGSAPIESVIRDGKVRCQGPFSHPILTGTFSAVMFPMLLGAYKVERRGRFILALSVLFTAVVTRASGSSGPIMAWGVGLFGWGIWRYRARVPMILRTFLVLGLIVHVVREKPIWHLIGRLAEVTGGTGYHRYLLIDAFVNHWAEWFLVGTSGTAHWGWGLQDTTNHYIAQAISGGFVTLVAFLYLLWTSFELLRKGRNAAELFGGPRSPQALLLWGFSVSLAAHCVSFISVSYFGQMEQLLFAFFAQVPALAAAPRPVGLPDVPAFLYPFGQQSAT